VKLALTSKKRIFSELLIQTGLDDAGKKDLTVVNEILGLCEELNIAVREFSKHDLNMLTDSRPHQGFVLRASPREFIDISTLPPSESFK
jgi:21S rRNA (GM2251-2'-O)-methyltransferase